jgi:hypothetical protein
MSEDILKSIDEEDKDLFNFKEEEEEVESVPKVEKYILSVYHNVEEKAAAMGLSANELVNFYDWCNLLVHPIFRIQMFFLAIGGIYCFFCHNFPRTNPKTGKVIGGTFITKGAKPRDISDLSKHPDRNKNHESCVLQFMNMVRKQTENDPRINKIKRVIPGPAPNYSEMPDIEEEIGDGPDETTSSSSSSSAKNPFVLAPFFILFLIIFLFFLFLFSLSFISISALSQSPFVSS